MSNSALDEFMNRKPSPSVADRPATENQDESGATDEINYRAYGANRSGRQVIMLDVRTLEGERLALGYSYLNNIFFDASGVMVLSFGSHNIRIEGRNLAPLYEKMLVHAVRFIQQENPKLEKDSSSGDTFISLIQIEQA